MTYRGKFDSKCSKNQGKEGAGSGFASVYGMFSGLNIDPFSLLLVDMLSSDGGRRPSYEDNLGGP